MRYIAACALLLLNFSALGAVESESNNTANNPNIITAGTIMTGHLSDNEDFDYYQLTVNKSDSLDIVFASPNSSSSENQWLLAIQRPSDGIIIFQEILSPSAESSINRNVSISETGDFLIFVAPAPGSASTPFVNYDLTVTPSNFQAPLNSFNGIWQDSIGMAFYAVQEGSEGILYIELPINNSPWKAYLGGRANNMATLDQIVGPGTAKIELKFLTAASLEARYISCKTEQGGDCSVPNGELIYTATFIYGD